MVDTSGLTLHGVVDREQRRDVPARRVDIQVDVLVGVLILQVQELGHDEVADRVVDGRAEEHDRSFSSFE